MTDDRTPTPSCPDLRDNLPELALGTLAGRERATTLAHLTTCSACSAEVEHLSATGDALLSLAPEVEPPEGFADRVRERFGQGGLTSGDTADPSGPGVARTDPPTVGGPGASASRARPALPGARRRGARRPATPGARRRGARRHAPCQPPPAPHPDPGGGGRGGGGRRPRLRCRMGGVLHHPQGRTVGALARAPLSSAGRTIGVAATYVAPRPPHHHAHRRRGGAGDGGPARWCSGTAERCGWAPSGWPVATAPGSRRSPCPPPRWRWPGSCPRRGRCWPPPGWPPGLAGAPAGPGVQ